MPRGKRAIGDTLRGKRDDVDMADAEVTRDAAEEDALFEELGGRADGSRCGRHCD